MTAPVLDELSSLRASERFRSYSDYIRQVVRVAVALTALERQAQELALTEDTRRLRETLGRLMEGAFSIAVVGEFKRGKSTLINALLGSSALPMDVLPATAAITRIVYGRTPEAVLHWREGAIERIPLEALSDYVTKADGVAATRAARIREAVVSFPTMFCHNNAEIVDTPGLSDERAMTELAIEIIAKADAAILVISALAPFGQTEASFLGHVLQHIDLGRIFFVLTHIDKLHGENEADRLLDVVRGRIGQAIEAAQPGPALGSLRLYPVSAWQALVGKESRDAALYEASRFSELETALERYLARDRGAAALSHANRVIDECAKSQLSALARQLSDAARNDSDEQRRFERRLGELDAVVAAIEARVAGVAGRSQQCQQAVRETIAARQQQILEVVRSAIDGVPLEDRHLSSGEERAAVIRQALERAVHPLIETLGRELVQAIGNCAGKEDDAIREIGRRLDAALNDREVDSEAPSVPRPAKADGAGSTMPLASQRMAAFENFAQAFKHAFEPSGGLLAEPALGVAGWALTNQTVRGGWRSMRGLFGSDGAQKADTQLRQTCDQIRQSLRRAYVSDTQDQIKALMVSLKLEDKAVEAVAALAEGLATLLARERDHVAQLAEWRRIELKIERARRHAASLHRRETLAAMQVESGKIADEAERDGNMLRAALATPAGAECRAVQAS